MTGSREALSGSDLHAPVTDPAPPQLELELDTTGVKVEAATYCGAPSPFRCEAESHPAGATNVEHQSPLEASSYPVLPF